jgi:hypothetical protein
MPNIHRFWGYRHLVCSQLRNDWFFWIMLTNN